MAVADIAPVSAAFLATQGWGDRSSWFDFAVRTDGVHAVVAVDEDGALIGTGATSIHGTVAWIGSIWVRPDRRGEHIGWRLTEHTIEVAEAAGCRTLVLVASEMGRPIYERMGFSTLTFEPVLEAPGLSTDDGRAGSTPLDRSATSTATANTDPDRRIRPWRATDLDAAAALDRRATGEDRRHLLAAFATPETAFVITGVDDVPRGFVVRASWGGGATIAPDPDDALALLDTRRRVAGPDKVVRAGLMESNLNGLTRLEADGWIENWRARRMIRGEPLDWDPDAIWGQFNHALG